MNSFFSANSTIIAGTLLVLVIFSIVTWSVAVFKLWRGLQDSTFNRALSFMTVTVR